MITSHWSVVVVAASFAAADDSSAACVRREATRDERWVTARGDGFLEPATLFWHHTADLRIDGRRVCAYRIQWFTGKWSAWRTTPGVDDVVDHHKSDDVWNAASFAAGRREWSMFADHSHEVCYCTEGGATPPEPPPSGEEEAPSEVGQHDECPPNNAWPYVAVVAILCVTLLAPVYTVFLFSSARAASEDDDGCSSVRSEDGAKGGAENVDHRATGGLRTPQDDNDDDAPREEYRLLI
mmetsp:Transcript_5619/g.23359  ORF Transcript_5619/g.23359 Transcript_5619/m.23359 type:complete len:239 (+) Transcript_5619:10-726(+)